MSVIEAEWRKRATAWFRRSQEHGPQGDQAAAHYDQLGAHARSKGLIAGTNIMKAFVRLRGMRMQNRV